MKNPLTIVSSTILILFFTLFLVTCQKEYSYEGSPQAVYSLEGSPDVCTNFIVNGNYYNSVATDTNNTVEVTANVTTTGSYSMVTNTVGGISFSAAGVFTDTGYQQVTLKCGGTPDSTGTYNFGITGDSGCSFLVQVVPKPPAQYLLSGSPNNCESPVFNGTYTVAKALSSSNTVVINVSVITPGDYSITTDTIGGVSFSASGVFTSTGDQTVTLTGTGTPSLSGFYYFNLIAGGSQCTFRIAVISAEPLATYVLESGTGANDSVFCAPQSIQGAYTAGVPLNASNTITVTAYPTVVGNYTISTDLFNGIIFSASGTFTAMAEQSVVLYGSGTPIQSGTFTFVPQIVGPSPIGGASCGVNLTIQ
jgi:hypothetical protein